ncbi:FUSC family protein [Swaminathania salitolerans]|uniref:Fusaric acid resistance protein n=1 Tax=Swaminathania salitolerans TaxID=182838 RepID=A0A511BKR7_9PROT|nr:FUSC family protein [Swaminathania salitolerans]GBQ09527.1 hypothetical protein AA21291_0106 [Swaminathania salitolerans LMG 21291]GEL00937.1 hypothetical protein SSA02_01000 [Swaminathania salitolerans]
MIRGYLARLDAALRRTRTPSFPLAWLFAPGANALEFALRNTVASLVALGIAFWMALGEPQWAAMTVWITAQGSRGESLSKGRWRLVGTLIGMVGAIGLVAAFPQTPWLFIPALALWAALCTGLATLFHNFRAYAFVLAAYTCAIIATAAIAAPSHVFEIAMARGTYIVLGVVCEMLAGVVFSSSLARRARHNMRRDLSEGIAATCTLLADVLEGKPLSEAAIAAVYARTLRLHDQMEFTVVELGHRDREIANAYEAIGMLSQIVSRGLGMQARLACTPGRSPETAHLVAQVGQFLRDLPDSVTACIVASPPGSSGKTFNILPRSFSGRSPDGSREGSPGGAPGAIRERGLALLACIDRAQHEAVLHAVAAGRADPEGAYPGGAYPGIAHPGDTGPKKAGSGEGGLGEGAFGEAGSKRAFEDAVILRGLSLILSEYDILFSHLETGPEAMPTEPRHRLRRVLNWRVSLHNGLRSAIAICLAGLVWHVTAWPQGAAFISFIAVVVGRFATVDNTVLASNQFFYGACFAALASIVPVFFLLPVANGFEGLCLSIAPFMFMGGLAVRNPSTANAAGSFVTFFPVLVGLDNYGRMDELSWCNTTLSLLLGLGAGVVIFRCVLPFDVDQLCRMLREQCARGLDRICRPRRRIPDERRWVGRITQGMERVIRYAGADITPVMRSELQALLSAMTLGRNLLFLRCFIGDPACPAWLSDEIGSFFRVASERHRWRPGLGPATDRLIVRLEQALGTMGDDEAFPVSRALGALLVIRHEWSRSRAWLEGRTMRAGRTAAALPDADHRMNA